MTIRERWHRLWNLEMKLKQVAPAYFIAFTTLILGAYTVNEFQQRYVDNAAERAVAIQFAQCESRVETRETLREVLLSITDVLDDSEPVDRIVVLIETRYPPLDLSDCIPV